MRVVMVGPFGLRPRGTIAWRALPMAKALAARGHQVVLLLPPWSCPEDSGREWEEEGVNITNIPLPRRIPLYWHLAITWRLTRRVLRANPQAVHCFKPKAYSGLVGMVLWGLKRLKVFRASLVMDSDDWEGAGGWNELREDYSRTQKRLFSFQERWGLTHCDAITVASRALETLAWSLGIPKGQVFYLPNGILEVANPGARGADHSLADLHNRGELSILVYTRFSEVRLERLMGIFRSIRKRMSGVRFLVVGTGFFGEEEQLLAQLEKEGMREDFSHIGWVAPQDLVACFALADVAMYPYDDTLVNRAKCGVKLIDLMAAGMPIVADAVGQNREYLEHMKSGFLVEGSDPEVFAKGVVALLRDESLRRTLGQEAKRRVYQRFNWGELVKVVEKVYLA